MKVSREQIERLRDHARGLLRGRQAPGGQRRRPAGCPSLAGAGGENPVLRGPQLHLRRLVGARSPGRPGGEAAASPEPEPDGLRVLWKWLVDNRLEAYRRDNRARVLECPIAVLAALIFLAWWLVAILLVVGFFFGWRYRFVGPHLGAARRSRT